MERKSRIEPTFFLDRTHGKRTSRLLQGIGMTIVLHRRWFIDEAPDPEWIKKCGQEKWIVLSGDKSIERVPENRQAVIDAKCTVIFFNDTNSLPEEWAAALIVGRPKLYEIIDRNNGPFFLSLDKHCRTHISSVRYCGSGGPKPPDAVEQVAFEGSSVISEQSPIAKQQYELYVPPEKEST
jgi:hypothetical protein